MQRATLTLLLGGAALVAALIVPRLEERRQRPPRQEDPTERPSEDPQGADGALELNAVLDRDTVAVGETGRRFLILEVSAPSTADRQRAPLSLALVFDTSGSMVQDDRIGDARRAASAIASRLSPEDGLALVTFDDQAWVRLRYQRVRDLAGFDQLIEGLTPGGGTNLYEGLDRGLNELNTPGERVRRVLLLSDGEANIGITEPEQIVALAGSRVQHGVTVSALGVGLDFNEDLLAKMSDAGGGSWAFADEPGSIEALLGRELDRLTATVAREATLRIEPSPGARFGEVYGWSARKDGRGLQIFLGDLYAGETRKVVVEVSGLPDWNPDELGRKVVAKARLRYNDLGAGPVEERAMAMVDLVEETADVGLTSDPDRLADVARALAGDAIEVGAASWAHGRREEARAQAEQAARSLQGLGASPDAVPELGTWLETIDAPMAEAEEKAAIKRAREAGRGIAR